MRIDTRNGLAAPPIWLAAVVDGGSGPVALVAIEPATAELYDALRARMLRGGFGNVNGRQWSTAKWSPSMTAAVDVVRGDLVRITTGQASVYTAGPFGVTEAWMAAALRRRALVALLAPGTLADSADLDDSKRRVGEAAASGRLLGTAAPVRFDLPVSRPGPRG